MRLSALAHRQSNRRRIPGIHVPLNPTCRTPLDISIVALSDYLDSFFAATDIAAGRHDEKPEPTSLTKCRLKMLPCSSLNIVSVFVDGKPQEGWPLLTISGPMSPPFYRAIRTAPSACDGAFAINEVTVTSFTILEKFRIAYRSLWSRLRNANARRSANAGKRNARAVKVES